MGDIEGRRRLAELEAEVARLRQTLTEHLDPRRQRFDLRRFLRSTNLFGDHFSPRLRAEARILDARYMLSRLDPATLREAERRELAEMLTLALDDVRAGNSLEPILARLLRVEEEIITRFTDDESRLAFMAALDDEAKLALPEAVRVEIVERIKALRDENGGFVSDCTGRLRGIRHSIGAIIVELYRARERVRDAISTLGLLMAVLAGVTIWMLATKPDLSAALVGAEVITVTEKAPSAEPAAGVLSLTRTALAQPADPASAQAGEPQTPDITDGDRKVLMVDPQPFEIILLMILLGGLGACLSGLITFTFLERVPGEYESWVQTLIRPLIGMAAGLIAVLVGTTGLITVVSTEPDKLAWLAVVALAFGFSERLIMGTIQRIDLAPEKK